MGAEEFSAGEGWVGTQHTVPARFIIQKDKLRVSKHSQILRPASATVAPFFGHASQSLTKDYRVDLIQQEWKVAFL